MIFAKTVDLELTSSFYTFDINFILSILTYGTILFAVFVAMIRIPRVILPALFGLAVISNYTFDTEAWQFAFCIYIAISTIVGIIFTIKYHDEWNQMKSDLYNTAVQRDKLLTETNELNDKLTKLEEKEKKVKKANQEEVEFLDELRKMP